MHKHGLDLLPYVTLRAKLDDLDIPPELVDFVFDIAKDVRGF